MRSNIEMCDKLNSILSSSAHYVLNQIKFKDSEFTLKLRKSVDGTVWLVRTLKHLSGDFKMTRQS